MPQLRSGVRRGRCRPPIAANGQEPSEPEQKNDKKPAAAKRTARNTRQKRAIVRKTGGRNNKTNDNNNSNRAREEANQTEPVLLVDDNDGQDENAVKETTPSHLRDASPKLGEPFGQQGGGEEEEEEDRKELVNFNLEEEVGEKEVMDEYDSGGRSGDKGLAAEDEGSTAPLPERVCFPIS